VRASPERSRKAPATAEVPRLAIATHGMETPPTHGMAPSSPPGTPIGIGEPGVGCTTEELRLWLVQKFTHVDRDATALEVRAATRINQVAGQVEEMAARVTAMEPVVRASAGALNDVGVFGNIKNFVTEQALQARTDLIEHELKNLAARGNQFTEHLDKHLLQLNGVELAFKGHVADGSPTWRRSSAT